MKKHLQYDLYYDSIVPTIIKIMKGGGQHE